MFAASLRRIAAFGYSGGMPTPPAPPVMVGLDPTISGHSGTKGFDALQVAGDGRVKPDHDEECEPPYFMGSSTTTGISRSVFFS